MSFIKQYKKDMEKISSTDIAFSGIKNKIDMEKTSKKKTGIILGSSIGGLALIGGAVALALVLNSGSSAPTPSDEKLSLKALAKNATPLMSATLSKEVNQNNLHKLVNRALIDNNKSDEEIIQDLLFQFDTIIENDNNYTVTSVTSDKPEYQYQENITFKDLLENTNTYSIYFNDISSKEEIEEDEYEKETIYSGIAVQNNQEYTFRLELNEEVEEDEKEVESKFYLYTSADKANYTKVTTSSEIEGLESETSYSYEIVENSVVTVSYSIEIETETQSNEVELSIELNEKEYSLTRVIKNNETYFYVELENEITDQETEYVYRKVINGNQVSYELLSQQEDIDDDND